MNPNKLIIELVKERILESVDIAEKNLDVTIEYNSLIVMFYIKGKRQTHILNDDDIDLKELNLRVDVIIADIDGRLANV